METTPTLTDWYKAYRTQGRPAAEAMRSARLHHEAETEAAAVLGKLSVSSRARIERFVDDFIRSEAVDAVRDENNRDWINDPEHADRVHKAAEHGAGGETHAEVIGDWREAFSTWSHERNGWSGHDRFEAAVLARFTLTELWHERNGSLWQELG